MKILIFADIHGNLNILHRLKRQVKDEKVDLVLCPGDFTMMGCETRAVLSRLNMFKVPVFLIHGNHEEEEEIAKLATEYPNITFLHKQVIEHKGWWFGSYSTSGLREKYPDQEAWVKENHDRIAAAAKSGKLIWMDHPPPSDTTLDDIGEDWHVGSHSFRILIENYQPVYAFCGHLHETFGREEMIGKTIVINPGPRGKVIELD